MIDLPAPLAVVCNDAGAANIILSWIAANPPDSLRPVMGGPAERLWEERFGSSEALMNLESAVEGAAAVLTGTGWASDLEHQARKLAASEGVRSAAVLDHWINYRERFRRGGEEVLPDELWVTDDQALALARNEFPETPVQLKPNLYLSEQVARAPRLMAKDEDVLFVAEPVRSDWGRGVPGEFQAIDYFLSRRSAVGTASGQVRLRPHPADPPGKYDKWTSSGAVVLDESVDIAAALAGVRTVVGCESFALVIGLFAGRHAISALPPWAPSCRLPHKEIVRLANL